jgi:electron transfer flavoprotein alpha subunit
LKHPADLPYQDAFNVRVMIMEIWIYAEFKSGGVTDSTRQLAHEGRRLADALALPLAALIAEPEPKRRLEELENLGLDRVYQAPLGLELSRFPELEADLIVRLCRQRKPLLILFCATHAGCEMAARVAAGLGEGLAAGVDRLWVSDQGEIMATRLCCERKIHETLKCQSGATHVMTLTGGPVKDVKIGSKNPEIIQLEIQPGAELNCRVEVTGRVPGDPRIIDISEAEIIVAGGKGVENSETFTQLQELADLIRGAVAGSRVAVDNAYIGRDRQIGQSGKSVAPELLISCGISGAQAHTVGMRDTKTIVCINTDANAPMMKMADLGVIGDLGKIIPCLIDLIRKHNTSS